jgi:predicted nuclease of predicted toxin-antitoxin system
VAERVNFYLDEHVPRAVVSGLRRRGVDVLTLQEAGMLGAEDEAHLALATQQGRVIFTQDADFLRLHATGIEHAGNCLRAPAYPGRIYFARFDADL